MNFQTLRLLAVLPTVPFALPASSFEQQGFRSCMSVAEAKAIGIRDGRPLVYFDRLLLEDGEYGEVYQVGRTKSDTSLVFSDGKLTRMSLLRSGGVDHFASDMETLIQALGQPRIEARSPTPSGSTSIVMATWSIRGTEKKSVTLTKTGEMIGVSVLDSVDRQDCK